MGRLGIVTRARDVSNIADRPATAQLGGIRLYAASEEKLKHGIALLGQALASESAALPSVDRSALQSLVRKNVADVVDDRLFGAILGQKLRDGTIDSVPCAAINYKVFRAFVHKAQWTTFHRNLSDLRLRLLSGTTLTVSQVRDLYFPGPGTGASSAAAHLLARLVLEGAAIYGPMGTFSWPTGLENAID